MSTEWKPGHFMFDYSFVGEAFVGVGVKWNGELSSFLSISTLHVRFKGKEKCGRNCMLIIGNTHFFHAGLNF